jgi:hypothetical protein
MARELILIPKEKYNMMLKMNDPTSHVIEKKEVLPITSRTLKITKTKRKSGRELIVKTNTDGHPPGYAVRKELVKGRKMQKHYQFNG